MSRICINIHQRYSIFFFRGHERWSFIHSNPKSGVFFFSREAGKKKIHFFPKKSSWAIHSILGRVSLFLLKIGLYFFFRIFGCFFCIFFFQWKVHLPFIHSISGLFFFSVAGKKKTAFSFIQSIFSQSVVKINFRWEK